ncbi:MAG: hypothetical protein PHG85_04800, partial [Candidatus Altiarchaeota archaeon]|nr:hypothetical protein [Candidatus Altiarchaeota archaeon]
MSHLGQRSVVAVALLFVIALVFLTGFWFGGGFTGLAIFSPVVVYQPLNASTMSSRDFNLSLDGAPLSFSIYGNLTGGGKVFLRSGDESAIVLDSSLLAPERPVLGEDAAIVMGLFNDTSAGPFKTMLEYGSSDFGGGFSRPGSSVGVSVSSTVVPEGVGDVCTVWEVYSVDHASSKVFCYGAKACCAFSSLESSNLLWNDSLDLYIGAHGASASSIALAQVMSVSRDVSTPSVAVYGGWKALPLFFQQPVYRFSGLCEDSCSLSSLGSNVSLSVKLEPNSVIDVGGFEYSYVRGVFLNQPIIELSDRNISIWFVNGSGSPVGSYTMNRSLWGGVDIHYQNLPEGMSNQSERLFIEGLRSVPNSLAVILLDDSSVSSRFFVFNDSFKFHNMTLEFPFDGRANSVFECVDFNYSMLSCGRWARSDIEFSYAVDGNVVSFEATRRGVYALGYDASRPPLPGSVYSNQTPDDGYSSSTVTLGNVTFERPLSRWDLKDGTTTTVATTTTLLDNGDSCGGDGECSSGICEDGYCCSNRCSGNCNFCNRPGYLGSCVSVDTVCGECGTCIVGSCTYNNNDCSSCYECTGSGTSYSCTPFTADEDIYYPGSHSCFGSCTKCVSGVCTNRGTDEDSEIATACKFCSGSSVTDYNLVYDWGNSYACNSGYYCSTGSCVYQKDDGQSCTDDIECLSGDCSGGFCVPDVASSTSSSSSSSSTSSSSSSSSRNSYAILTSSSSSSSSTSSSSSSYLSSPSGRTTSSSSSSSSSSRASYITTTIAQLRNADFELGSFQYWSQSYNGETVTSDDKHGGTYSASLNIGVTGASYINQSMASNSPEGICLWVKGNVETCCDNVTLSVLRDTGVYVRLAEYRGSNFASWTQQCYILSDYLPIKGVKIEGYNDVGDVSNFYIDDITFGNVVSSSSSSSSSSSIIASTSSSSSSSSSIIAVTTQPSLKNPSFEIFTYGDFSYWTRSNNGEFVSSTEAHVGSYSADMINSISGVYSAINQSLPENLVTEKLCLWAYGYVESCCDNLSVSVLRNTGVYIPLVQFRGTSLVSWTEYCYDITAYNPVKGVKINGYNDAGDVSTFYIDDVSFMNLTSSVPSSTSSSSSSSSSSYLSSPSGKSTSSSSSRVSSSSSSSSSVNSIATSSSSSSSIVSSFNSIATSSSSSSTSSSSRINSISTSSSSSSRASSSSSRIYSSSSSSSSVNSIATSSSSSSSIVSSFNSIATSSSSSSSSSSSYLTSPSGQSTSSSSSSSSSSS